MMKLGLVSAILPNLTFEEVIDYAASVGFECAEICCWPKGKALRRYAGITHIDASEAEEAKLLYYADYAKARGVPISSLAYYPNPLDEDKEASDMAVSHIMRLIDASARMGVGLVTTFIGRSKTKTVEENLELYEKVWTPIVKLAEEKGVKIGIENCPMLYTKDEWPGGVNLASTPAIWRKMFELIPSPNLGLNLDPSHLYLIGSDYVRVVYEFRDRIFHVHFKDILVNRDLVYEHGVFSYPALWHFPKLPGLGGVDFGAFVSALNDIRYTACACIEVEDKAYEGSPEDVKKAIEQAYRYMKNFV